MAEISKMLPGYNCGECCNRQCKDYADEISKIGDISKCPYLELERFRDTKAEIEEFLSTHIVEDNFEDFLLTAKVAGRESRASKVIVITGQILAWLQFQASLPVARTYIPLPALSISNRRSSKVQVPRMSSDTFC